MNTKNRKLILAFLPLLLLTGKLWAFDWVIVKYRAGDWYNARAGVGNFLLELKSRTTIEVDTTPVELSLDDERIFERQFLFLNGHVPVDLNTRERQNLRKFILNGGFVFANDDYGMDESFRRVVKEVFPEYPFEQVAFEHEIYHCFYDFPNGLPKIHEHDAKPPEGWGLFIDGRLAIYYAYSSDIADGWDYPEVHHDPAAVRESAFRMGVNIVVYALSR